MDGKSVLGALVIGIGAGVIFTPAPIPETKVITVKRPPITHKETVTRTIVKPLPTSCKNAAENLRTAANKSNNVNNTAKKFFTYLDELDRRRMTDMEAVHKTEKKLGVMLRSIEEDTYGTFQSEAQLESVVDQCESDIKEVSE